ncbi:MAG TPA: hypothetical protein PKC12_00015 [Thiobacillaceae bacterium]|nr:hypothetical protein [Thiobacillaceae bacterium]
MKYLAWILLAANLAVAGFFLSGGQWPQAMPGGLAPLNVDRLSLRDQDMATPAPTAPVAPAREPLCVEWRGLTADEFVQARERLKVLAGNRVMSFTEVPLETRHWVVFPPLPSAETATAKLDELVASGLQDAFVVRDGIWRNALSLGLFASNDAARRRVREVEEKGIHGTRIELVPRQGTGLYFVIRSEDPEVLKSLGSLAQVFPNSTQSRVACP